MDAQTTQQDHPQRMTRLEYARAMQAAHGSQAPVTWLTIGEVVAMLERLADFEQPQPLQLDRLSFALALQRQEQEV